MNSECFWEEYIPSKLRPKAEYRKQIEYFIGHNMYGEDIVCYGPHPCIEKVIEIVPEMVPSYIYRSNPDGTNNVLYRWEKDRWVREKEYKK